MPISYRGGAKMDRIQGKVTAYAQYPGEEMSNIWTVTVNGVSIFVHSTVSVHFARFKLSGEGATVVAELRSGSLDDYSLSPKAYELPENRNGAVDTITIGGNCKFYLDGPTPLIVFAEVPEENPPDPDDANVTNIMSYDDIDNTGGDLITSQINRAITDISNSGGSKTYLYFPRGVYKTGLILMKPNVKIYLAEDAMILFDPDGNYWNDSLVPLCTNNEGPGIGSFYFDNADNAGIIGRGIINGSGVARRESVKGKFCACKLIKPVHSKNLLFDGILLLDNWDWCVNLTDCDNATLRNVKMISHLIFHTDGFNLDVSRNTLVDDCFAWSGDDTTCLKAIGVYPVGPWKDLPGVPHVPNSNNTFKNCVMVSYTGCRALRIGYGFEGDGYNKDNKIYNENQWSECNNTRYYNCHFKVGQFIDSGNAKEPKCPVDNVYFIDCSVEKYKNNYDTTLDGGTVFGHYYFTRLKYYFDGRIVINNGLANFDGFTINGNPVNSIEDAGANGVTIIGNATFNSGGEY
jgi:hypothetical protein